MTHPDEQASPPLCRCRCGVEPRWIYSQHLQRREWNNFVAVSCWECGLLGRSWYPADADGHRQAAEAWAERVSEA